jgi:hypothetical protein
VVLAIVLLLLKGFDVVKIKLPLFLIRPGVMDGYEKVQASLTTLQTTLHRGAFRFTLLLLYPVATGMWMDLKSGLETTTKILCKESNSVHLARSLY